MIFRRSSGPKNIEGQSGVRSAWQVFLDTQKNIAPPYGIVLQAEHAGFAGALATNLHPDIFGSLPPEVIAGIAEHDAGWQSGDEAQLNAIAEKPPKPFPLLPGEQSIPYWNESIRKARQLSPLTGVIVSRHFCALALQDRAHRAFLEHERPRRESIERTLGIAPAELDRWTGAIGFCDILSLYLCSGSAEPVEFPLAHPALPESGNARKVFLDWTSAGPRFSSPLIRSDVAISFTVRERQDWSPVLIPQTLSLSFAG